MQLGFILVFVVISYSQLVVHAISDCRILQNGYNGIFTSPRYPDNYNNSLSCQWTITSPSTTRMQLRFTDFDLEQSNSCTYDYLEIFDSSSTLIGRFCGNNIPDLIESQSNKLYLVFRTDSADTRRGFEATWIALGGLAGSGNTKRQIGGQCGGEFTDEEGVLQSTNFPLPYEASSSCKWTIKTDAYHEIILTFEFFELEQHSVCRYDYVIIKDGATKKAKEIGKYCGRNSPGTIKATGNVLQVMFVSDTTTQRKGFKATWKLNRKTSVTPSDCGGALNDEKGIVTSPGYPKSVTGRTICTWSITVPEGGRVKFEFVDIDISEHPACGKGYVELRDGKMSTDKSLGSFCGFVLPRPLLSEKNVITVGYLSDGDSKTRGFQAKWTTVYPSSTKTPPHFQKETKCGQTFTTEKGQITRSTGTKNCSWTIEVPRGKMVSVSVVEINMADDPDCRREQLEVRDGANLNSPFLARTCGQLKPRPVTSSSNVIVVRHTIFKKQQTSRLKLVWEAVGVGEENELFNTGSCGISTATPKFVKKGAVQGLGTTPWVVGIMGMFGRVHCGGAILSSEWIITAAHCFERVPWKSLWTVRAGEYDLKRNEGTEQTVGIRKIIMHPNYNSKTHDNDITLLRLNRPLTLNAIVKTVCLPSAGTMFEQNKKCSLAGWGARKFLRQPKEPLVHVLPKLINRKKCNSSAAYDGKITDRMLCAGNDRIDSCQGDGGSPLTCVTQDKNYVIGLASWGNGCGFPGKYGVYTDVRKYINWINDVVKRNT